MTPVMPRKRAAGRPRNSATGRAMSGPRTIVPMKTPRIPMPSSLLSAPLMTHTMMASPKAIEERPPMRRLRPGSRTSSAVARMAASGDTLPARRAGSHADATVTKTPTINVCCTVFALSTSPPLGRSILRARNIALSPFDKPIPAMSPIKDPTMPTASDSINMALVTCLRLAPIARSNAFSRCRWAALIENTL